jgi:hypothetical protein
MGKKGIEYIVYSQSGSSFTVDLSGTSSSFTGRFYDPRSGQFQPSFTLQGGSSSQSFTKPSSSDWVLHLVKSGGPTSSPTLTPTPQPDTPGDGNNDGLVDGQDFIIWLTHFGQNVSGASNGDYNDSGKVEIGDYIVWVSNY